MGKVYRNPSAYLPAEILPGYCAPVPAEPDLILREGVGAYVPRNPEGTVLYGVVAGHLETFLARQRNRDRVVFPASWNGSCADFWIAAFWPEVF